MSRNYSLTSTDRTHNVGITNVWELPFGPGRHWVNEGGVLSHIVGGWQVNNLISIMSGTPFSVLADDTSLNLPGSVQTADQGEVDRAAGGAGRGTPTTIGVRRRDRGTVRQYRLLLPMRGPGLFNWDFGLTRSPLPPVRLQFRVEAFNFTNTPHLMNPNNTVGDEEFMTITETHRISDARIDDEQFRLVSVCCSEPRRGPLTRGDQPRVESRVTSRPGRIARRAGGGGRDPVSARALSAYRQADADSRAQRSPDRLPPAAEAHVSTEPRREQPEHAIQVERRVHLPVVERQLGLHVGADRVPGSAAIWS